MEYKPNLKKMLVDINNQCNLLSTLIEDYLDEPQNMEMLDVMAVLADRLRRYLNLPLELE